MGCSLKTSFPVCQSFPRLAKDAVTTGVGIWTKDRSFLRGSTKPTAETSKGRVEDERFCMIKGDSKTIPYACSCLYSR